MIKDIFIPNKNNNYRPKLLESRILTGLVVFVVLLKIAIVPFLIYFPKLNLFADVSKATIIKLLNNDRTSRGLGPLKENYQLDKSALLKAQDIIKNGYFDHYSPQGKSPWYWFKISGYKYSAAGENLGIGFLDSEEIYKAWKNSPTHRANLLNPRYKEIGIAVVQGVFQGRKTTIVVQHFGSPSKTPLPVKPKQVITQKQPEKQLAIMGEQTQDIIPPKEDLRVKAFKFITLDYQNIIQRIMFACFIFILLSLLVNIFVEIKVQHKDLIGKTISLSVLLLIFILTNKELFIKLIPHNLGV